MATERDSRPPEDGSVPPSSSDPEPRRRRLEGVIPDLIKRAVELGVEKASEAPDSLKSFVGELKLPKEIASALLQQMEETKNGLFRVVAKEMREFLQSANLAAEMQKLLTTVQFEVSTTIRFRPNDGAAPTDTDETRAKGEGTPEGGAGAQGSASPPTSPSVLPRPEVKTAVHVKRDDRSRRRARE